MARMEISSVMEDYLKAIFTLHREKGRANTNDIAKAVKVSAPTVTQTIKRLVELQLAEHVPYKGVILTPAGEKIAIEVIRHHRLIERYLHEALGIPWDQVHKEAELLEHVISEEVEKKMAEFLNHPTRDPHGSPIPSPDLVLEDEDSVPLSDIGEGEEASVAEVPDEDPDLLQYIEGLGLVPNTRFRVQSTEPYGGSIVLEVAGERVRLGAEAARLIKARRL
ncbi:MAG: metal-dependent transcriptional regulator [Deltaproteobacteria bacterium]